jgi:N-acetylglucosamine kinase-like BadF-type ATPase
MREVFLGVDGGGTKTHACIVDLQGNILGTAANGGANWERSGIGSVQKSLDEIIGAALRSAQVQREDIVDSTLALAGIDWEEDQNLFIPVIQELGLQGRCTLINDSFAALFAGAPSGIGCVSIAGTGGKSAGRDGVRTVQTMGMDLGEGGGAGQLISLTLESIARSFHGIQPRTALYTEFVQFMGFQDTKAFFIAIARDRIDPNESIAPLIFDLCSRGDIEAIKIVSQVAKQHALDIYGVVNQLDFRSGSIPIVRAGGLHTANNAIFDNAFETELKSFLPLASISVLNVAPVYGSVIQAAQRFFTETPDNFLKNLNGAAQKVNI